MTTTQISTATCTLDIGGMTCASCVGRVERALGKLDGVTSAQVNLATEVAAVTYDPQLLQPEDLTRAVTGAGYTAAPHREPDEPAPPTTPPDDDQDLRRLKHRWQLTLAVGLG